MIETHHIRTTTGSEIGERLRIVARVGVNPVGRATFASILFVHVAHEELRCAVVPRHATPREPGRQLRIGIAQVRKRSAIVTQTVEVFGER
jgi:ABC-type branched-subunit amino acid transport system ATPase component